MLCLLSGRKWGKGFQKPICLARVFGSAQSGFRFSAVPKPMILPFWMCNGSLQLNQHLAHTLHSDLCSRSVPLACLSAYLGFRFSATVLAWVRAYEFCSVFSAHPFVRPAGLRDTHLPQAYLRVSFWDFGEIESAQIVFCCQVSWIKYTRFPRTIKLKNSEPFQSVVKGP